MIDLPHDHWTCNQYLRKIEGKNYFSLSNKEKDVPVIVIFIYTVFCRAVIMFVVEDITYNICDQRFHEYEIRKMNPEVKVIRRNLTQIADTATLSADKELIMWVFPFHHSFWQISNFHLLSINTVELFCWLVRVSSTTWYLNITMLLFNVSTRCFCVKTTFNIYI
jgi:hypothetical protein